MQLQATVLGKSSLQLNLIMCISQHQVRSTTSETITITTPTNTSTLQVELLGQLHHYHLVIGREQLVIVQVVSLLHFNSLGIYTHQHQVYYYYIIIIINIIVDFIIITKEVVPGHKHHRHGDIGHR